MGILHISSETRKAVKEQVIRLRLKGKKGVEIADLLNLSEQAVSRVVRSCKKECMNCLEEEPRGRSW